MTQIAFLGHKPPSLTQKMTYLNKIPCCLRYMIMSKPQTVTFQIKSLNELLSTPPWFILLITQFIHNIFPSPLIAALRVPSNLRFRRVVASTKSTERRPALLVGHCE